jgi:hypothetical protein
MRALLGRYVWLSEVRENSAGAHDVRVPNVILVVCAVREHARVLRRRLAAVDVALTSPSGKSSRDDRARVRLRPQLRTLQGQ